MTGNPVVRLLVGWRLRESRSSHWVIASFMSPMS